MQDIPSIPAHPVKNHGECLSAEQAPRASQYPPHDFGLPVERWQTYARGFTRCKRHQKNLASCPAHPEKSLWECLRECRREQPPMSRPTTPLSQTKSRLADFREGLRAVPALYLPWPGTPGKQPPGVPCAVANGHYPPNARHTQQKAVGSGYTDASAHRKPQFPSPAPANKKPLARTSELANGT